jgi:hypothetical protein
MLCAGAILMSLVTVPNALQLAAGWAHFTFFANLAGLAFVPLGAWATLRFGAIGAAAILPCVAVIHLIVPPALLHRRILRAERAKWYLIDLGLPIAASAVIGVIARSVFQGASSRPLVFLQLTLVWMAASAAILLIAPALRGELLGAARRLIAGGKRASSSPA